MFGDKKVKIKDSERSLISETVSIEGTINSSGAIDVAGLIKGPVYSQEVIIKETGSISGEILSRLVVSNWKDLKCAPQRLAMPDVPEPTSPALTKGFYIRARDIAEKIISMCESSLKIAPKDARYVSLGYQG